MQPDSKDKILKLIREKVILKQDVFVRTSSFFQMTKSILQNILAEVRNESKKLPSPVPLDYQEKGDFEVEITIGDDTLVFIMHSNIYVFDLSHEFRKQSYIQDDPMRAFCGKIYVYNFSADSFRYNRPKDIGQLIARIIINKEDHFLVEGQRQMNFLFNDFATDVLNKERLEAVLTSMILFALDFDPTVPPYEELTELSVAEVLASSMESKFATAKRLGFRFQSGSDSAM